ncbi:alkene reductase [Chitinophaga pinensis]|uniref:NADH:flavin oxidoreductase/NADH oxidase n=1 Tax=Chitinophaga pinensis (strain ATCC 43595 / DSM 2588 / LMG 13176 / NBRC 15968 / NCIMB 11800 / UQM 2034) TaxID=485918 RepID=A0A979G6T0_CHIPD|nr:alkene reductase [Chitinophaga pinensis]ACU61795.1 NADH:flavin oxidoreductase/NADH oxidase [Chitinophaga pinensis DSM 2588]
MKQLFTSYTKGSLQLKNHVVMAPMTRSRALGNVPNDLMATYYKQRSGAGLIITEGTSPSPEGLGYPRIPGIFSEAQVEAWKAVTKAVHERGSKIFLQLMHTGRIAHIANLPEGYHPVGLSDIKAAGEIFTDKEGMQEHSVPLALDAQGIELLINDFVKAAENAIKAGFDGVELHGANGYILEQSLNPHVNNRTDSYGGTIENRSRLIIAIAERTARVIGAEKVGVRLSPYSALSDMPAYDEAEVHATYAYLSGALNKLGVAYLHISDNPAIPEKTHQAIRSAFSNTIIYCNGLTPETAESKLQAGSADLVAFGRSFLANPDFMRRMEKNDPLNEVDYMTLYTPGEQGYTDYPVLN